MARTVYHKAIKIMAIIQKLHHKKEKRKKYLPQSQKMGPVNIFGFSKEMISIYSTSLRMKVCPWHQCTLDVDNMMMGIIFTTANLAILEVKHYRDIGATRGEQWEDGKLSPSKELTRSLEILWPAEPSIHVFLHHRLTTPSGTAFPRGLTLRCLPAWQRFTSDSMWLERKIKILCLPHSFFTPASPIPPPKKPQQQKKTTENYSSSLPKSLERTNIHYILEF